MRTIVYRPAERPNVEVEVNGRWYEAELRMWQPDADGAWRGQVQWHRAVGSTLIDTFPSARIRRVDR